MNQVDGKTMDRIKKKGNMEKVSDQKQEVKFDQKRKQRKNVEV